MKRRILLVSLILMVFVLTACGPKPIVPPITPTATLSGYVTLYRGGQTLAGARIQGPGIDVVTNDKGYFNIEITAEEKLSLLITKEGYAKGKVQDIFLPEAGKFELEIPLREPFMPNPTTNPPTILVEGVELGDVVAGDLPISVTIDGEVDTYVFYVYFCGLQRFPVEFNAVGANEGEGVIDTTAFPNGYGFVRILAYDNDGNSTTLIIPVIIDNEREEPVEEVPADLEWLTLVSTTLGDNIGYYSNGGANLNNVDANASPDDSTISVILEWGPVEDAEGYHVYRGLDDGNMEIIANIPYYKETVDEDRDNLHLFSFQDMSAILTPEVPLTYEVIPYNAKGEGEGISRSVTPLVPLIVNLATPAHLANEVPLRPTFTWESSITASEDTTVQYKFFLIWSTVPWGMTETIIDDEEYTLDEDLTPGTVFSWDILEADAFTIYEDDEEKGYSVAFAKAGAGNGSLNGDFIFTTTLDIEEE